MSLICGLTAAEATQGKEHTSSQYGDRYQTEVIRHNVQRARRQITGGDTWRPRLEVGRCGVEPAQKTRQPGILGWCR